MTIMDLQKHPFIRKNAGSDQDSATVGKSDQFDSDGKTIKSHQNRAKEKITKYRKQELEIDEDFSEADSSDSYDAVGDKGKINMVSSLPYPGEVNLKNKVESKHSRHQDSKSLVRNLT